MKIALDPAMYRNLLSVADELRKAADLGYEYLELSPRPDWFFWHRYPKADNTAIAEVKKAQQETGVRILTLVPVFNWSGGDPGRHLDDEFAADLQPPVIERGWPLVRYEAWVRGTLLTAMSGRRST